MSGLDLLSWVLFGYNSCTDYENNSKPTGEEWMKIIEVVGVVFEYIFFNL